VSNTVEAAQTEQWRNESVEDRLHYAIVKVQSWGGCWVPCSMAGMQYRELVTCSNSISVVYEKLSL